MLKTFYLSIAVLTAFNVGASSLLDAKKKCYEAQLNVVKYSEIHDLNLALVKKRDQLVSCLTSEIPELNNLDKKMQRAYATHLQFPEKPILLSQFLNALWELELKLENIKKIELRTRSEYIDWEIALTKYESKVANILQKNKPRHKMYLYNLNILKNNRFKVIEI
jgi:hypothetical protein